MTSFSYFEGKRIKKVFVFPKDLFTDLVGQVTKDQYCFESEYYYTSTYYVLQSMRRKGRKEGSASRAEKRNKIIKTKDEDYLSDQQKCKQKNATSNID